MIITWHGVGAVKIVEKEVTVAINPHGGEAGKMPKFSADILLLGHKEATATPIRDNPFVIDGPGEYERKGVFVYGVPAEDGDSGLTVFVVEVSGVKIGYLGGLNQDQLTTSQRETIEGVDILLIPVGGKDVLNAKQAVKIINQVEPRVVVPIEYKTAGMKTPQDGVETFIKEYGVASSKMEETEKYKITKKDLPNDDTTVVIIKES